MQYNYTSNRRKKQSKMNFCVVFASDCVLYISASKMTEKMMVKHQILLQGLSVMDVVLARLLTFKSQELVGIES